MDRRVFNRKRFLTLCGIALTSFGWSQAYVQDAGRFSLSTFGGTARMQAMGGAQHALGGDLSTISGNPAGLGVYTKSEFSISPGLQFNRSQNTYRTPSDVTQTDAARNNFHIANFGFVVNTSDKTAVRDWKGGTWGISFDRFNDFQRRMKFKGNNDGNNLRAALAANSQGIDTANYNLDNSYYYELYNTTTTLNGIIEGNDAVSDLANQGYWSDLFYFNTSSNTYQVFDEGKPVIQEGEVLTKGSQSQWNIAYGNNYKDKFYVGGSINVGSLRYIEETTYTETSTATDATINNYTNTRTLEQRGTGLSTKIGFIYRITDHIRFGSAFQSPTWYVINEEFEQRLSTQWNTASPIGYTNYDYSTRIIEYDYQLRTPMRWTNGLSIFFGKLGFLTVDAEYVPYKQAKFSKYDDDFSDVNSEIKNTYKNVWNLRAGAEVRFNSLFIRGGYAWYANPVINLDNTDRGKRIYTGGLGYRFGDQHIDFTIVSENQNVSYSHYQMPDGTEPVNIAKNRTVRAVFTWGVYLE